MPFQLFSLASLGFAGHVPKAEQEFLNGGWACYRPYRLRDGGVIALGAIEAHFWNAFCQASARPDWIERHDEALPQQALIADIEAHFALLSSADIDARYGGVDCCLQRVRDLEAAVHSTHFRERGLVRRHPSMSIYEAAFPVRIDGQPPALREPLEEI
jgi:alpha-methylacyl-CoA racemase